MKLLQDKDEIFMKIEGNGFLYNMVRIIAGTLVFIGKGKITLQDIEQAFESGDRTKLGKTFPAQGLYLEDVFYDDLEK
jgi:tRNA pseudouridine38-40 synthase